ncbi:Uncharacterized membrane protein YeaQ/YmgE, transglycosylase-associated protein family [Rhodovulum sp. ES.010]|uniref:GlsB/YeaQ/YmgE family stress response membrane protein n=1 Tax=Rhodovulum sp. ES.010 TaxID=1882821 RepID=UPI00092AA672|nr:GlsB/YeaQ/YmgE family stress response membrane protein [Rhodovulum sp. ES.010]SIO47738.1 Uncharacterized membrane protein YeaQ/YmgE, transglycosylase-associated protein family [Rhodovulum sp. ES.010]
MMKTQILAAAMVVAPPALAQVQGPGPNAMGAVIGGLIGIVVLILIGALVGWLTSLIVKGSGSGFWGDVLIGIGGALLAGRVLPALGIPLGGWVGSFVGAVIGAVLLIVIVRLIRKAAN